MISEKRIKGSVIVFMLACLGLLITGFYYLVTAQIPLEMQIQQLIEADQNRPPLSGLLGPRLQQDELEARDIRKKWLEIKPAYDVVMADYAHIPRFKPPADGHLTEKQILAMYDIYMSGVREIRHFQIYDLGNSPGMFKAFISYAYLPALVELVRKRGLVKHQMTDDELNWVVFRTMEAALFACNRQWETGQGTPEERKRLETARYGLSNILRLVEERTPEEGGSVTHPERLNDSKIPRANLALFLKLHENVRWSGARFYGMNFDENYIMRAAKSLPE